MISCFLFGFAVPLAIFASPLLRFAVWLYNSLAGWLLPAPRMPRPEAEELVPSVAGAHAETTSDRVTHAPKRVQQNVTTIPTAEPAGPEAVAGQLYVPTFKMAVATLFLVFIATAIVSGFGKLVVMAFLEIVRGKGLATRTDFSTLYNVVELLFLPLGFLLLARLLQEILPADFGTACLVAALYLVLFFLVLLILVGLLKLWFLLYAWIDSLTWLAVLPAGCHASGFARILLDLPR